MLPSKALHHLQLTRTILLAVLGSAIWAGGLHRSSVALAAPLDILEPGALACSGEVLRGTCVTDTVEGDGQVRLRSSSVSCFSPASVTPDTSSLVLNLSSFGL